MYSYEGGGGEEEEFFDHYKKNYASAALAGQGNPPISSANPLQRDSGSGRAPRAS